MKYPDLEGLFSNIDEKVIERKSGMSQFGVQDVKRNTFLNFEDPHESPGLNKLFEKIEDHVIEAKPVEEFNTNDHEVFGTRQPLNEMEKGLLDLEQ